MRKRFELQYSIGQKRIEDVTVDKKCRDAFPKLIAALKKLYVTPEYNEKVFSILEDKLVKGKSRTGRPGMDLWTLFVLAQARLCLNISYDRLHDLANNHGTFRQIMGIESDYSIKKVTIEYQNIIDNVCLLEDSDLQKINDVIVNMGHEVFKKKETEALHLKTDSFVVKSNVHFPTDYNLLWDSARKCSDVITYFTNKYPSIKGWRNLSYWYRRLKNMSREIGQSSKKSEEKRKELVGGYLKKALLFSQKIKDERDNLSLIDEMDLIKHLDLEYFLQMLDKHIDLLERRVIKGETIPHSEKIFSIFETYTEWVAKGKQYPNVELGKNVQITTDQFHLIIDGKVMEHQVDKSTVISLSDRILSCNKVSSWSFDKGFFTKENKELLSLFVDNLVMPKKGKLNKTEHEQEHQPTFKKLRNKHSAVESNINELEHKGLDRCPDKGYRNFKRYISLGICAYNLHRIGAELLRQEKEKLQLKKAA
jgi:transposase, IS5 family